MIQITCDWREYLDYKLPEIEQLLNRKITFKWKSNTLGAAYQVGEVTKDELNILRLCTNIDWWIYDPDRS